ncbi:MAG: Immunoglobulin I-set domain protein [Cyanobacteria bacterium RYN_339]|nr:Immunoglobulin I-set domain protein [Cyanobacteria bacterium RYN_339]
MPGLYALVDFHRRADLAGRQAAQLATAASVTAVWREPEGRLAAAWVSNGLRVGAKGPATSPDGQITALVDGELVDLAEGLVAVRRRGAEPTGRGPADLLVATYMLDGLEGVAKLEGAYFFVIWDGRAGVAYLGGDRHASRPHFYALHDDRLVVAPDVRGVLAGLDTRPPVCWQGVAEFLALEHPLADRTFFEGVRAFPGGTFLAATPRGTRWHVYWTPRYSGAKEARPRVEDYVEAATERYRAAVVRRLEGRCVLSLSGGTDSRLLLALAADAGLATFTFGQAGSDDMRFAAQAAAAAGVVHEPIPLRPDFLAHFAPHVIARGEGMSSLFHAHNLDGVAEVRALAPVVLCGGAAEFARLDYAENVLAASGPAWQLMGRRALEGRRPLVSVGSDEELARRLLAYAWNVITPAMAQEVLAPELARAMGRTLGQGVASQLARIKAASPEDRLMTFNLINRQRRFSQWGLTLSAPELTYRKPLEDYALVDFLLRVPATTRRALPDAVIRRLAPGLARVPRTGTMHGLQVAMAIVIAGLGETVGPSFSASVDAVKQEPTPPATPEAAPLPEPPLPVPGSDDGEVTTLAGTGEPKLLDGPGKQAAFFGPLAVALDDKQHLYVAESDGVIRVVDLADPGHAVSTLAGKPNLFKTEDGPAATAKFHGIRGLQVVGTRLFITETARDGEGKYLPGGVLRVLDLADPAHPVTTVAGKLGEGGHATGPGAQARFTEPTYMAVDPQGNLALTDLQARVVCKVDLHSGAYDVSLVAGIPSDGKPITNSTTYGYDGPPTSVALTTPAGLAYDAAGALWLTDGRWVRRLGPDGVLRVVAGGGDFGELDGYWLEATLAAPIAMAALPGGDVVVGEGIGFRLRRLRMDAGGRGAVVWTAAGPNGQALPELDLDGKGAAARFSAFFFMVADGQGNAYVSETGTHRIRQIKL